MLEVLRRLARVVELAITVPVRMGRFLLGSVVLNPRLGRLRLIIAPLLLYILFAFTLVYVYAPVRGITGQVWMGKVLRYANERSLGTAIYDAKGRFVGVFDGLLDSQEDFNSTGKPIKLPTYIAYPDHKSLHVGRVPDAYWSCLAFHEDRHLGGWLNPFGIDLLGVLKIPVTTLRRSVALKRPALGAGGSTISMQLARIFFKTPPNANESTVEKLTRKFREWWLAPVIHWELTRGGDDRLRRWAANHFPLAQRTGGQALYGVEQTSLVLFGTPADQLSVAKQYVLAAAVNRPVILLKGNSRINKARLRNWKKITRLRARTCAEALIADPKARSETIDELLAMSAEPPDPKVPADIETALLDLVPQRARFAGANPIQRSNVLVPSAKYGVRDQMKNLFGLDWRSHVRNVQLTLDVPENLRFRNEIKKALRKLDRRFAARLAEGYGLDLDRVRRPGSPLEAPDIIIAAANAKGELVRYFEANFNASYFGSPSARDRKSGRYASDRESRTIASVGKMLAAIAIANDGTDTGRTGYLDTRAPARGLETCRKGGERRLRRAEVAFACSLNNPLEWRLGKIPSAELKRLTRDFGMVMPDPRRVGPNAAKSLVVGHVRASPRAVHRMAGAVLARLTGAPDRAAAAPSLVRRYAMTDSGVHDRVAARLRRARDLIREDGVPMLRQVLSAPICYPHGTLRRISDWCDRRRPGVTLHFAKTGTRGTGSLDPNAPDTVDLWVAGGIQFATGHAFSYVVLIGTGSPGQPWARDMYAGSTTEPLLRVLLKDLERLANRTKAAPSAATLSKRKGT